LKCKFKTTLTGGEKYECPRDAEEGGDYCIFHCDKENFTEKEINEFENKFWEDFERRENDKKLEEFNFTGFKFPDKFSFENREFKKPVNFRYAKFGDNANFRYAKFGDNANFRYAKFGSEANFWDAEFGNMANFLDAEFGNKTIFLDAEFGSEANFEVAKFGDNAYFFGTKFGDEANFWKAKFGSEANFEVAIFGNKANFGGARFGNKANFMNAKFGNKANFELAEFGNKANFRSATLQKANLKNADLLDAELTGTKLQNANIYLAKIENSQNLQYAKLDEDYIVINEKDGDKEKDTNKKLEKYNEAHDIYITLKNYFSKVGRYDLSGKYFIQEWRVKGKIDKVNEKYFSWFGNHLIDYFSEYGESWWKVLASAGGIIFLFATAYFLLNAITPIPCIEPTLTKCLAYKPPIIERILESIYFSIVSFTTLGYGDFHPKPGLFQLIAATEAFIGMFIMAFFTITVARKIMR